MPAGLFASYSLETICPVFVATWMSYGVYLDDVRVIDSIHENVLGSRERFFRTPR